MAILPALAALAFSAYFAAMISLHLVPTGLRPVEDALSHYATSSHPRLAAVAAYANIAGLLLLSTALTWGVGTPRMTANAVVPFVMMALTRIGTRLFPLDAPDRQRTSSGRLHLGLAGIYIIAAVTALGGMIPVTAQWPGWRGPIALLDTMSDLAPPLAVAVGICFVLPPLRKIFGLAERLFMLDTNGWLWILACILTYRVFAIG